MFRDQTVLPEVANRPLLPMVFFSYSTFEILSESSRGTFGSIHQAAAWEVFGIGGWCVLSRTSIQISKFTVQAQGYVIRYVNVCNEVCNNVCNDLCKSKLQMHNSEKSPPPNLPIRLSSLAWSYGSNIGLIFRKQSQVLPSKQASVCVSQFVSHWQSDRIW